MEILYRISNRPVITFTFIYISSVILNLSLKGAGFSRAQAFNANIICFLILGVVWMMTFLRFLDESKKNDLNVKMMRSVILIMQMISYSIAIMITPLILE